jgi:hypothetical protein
MYNPILLKNHSSAKTASFSSLGEKVVKKYPLARREVIASFQCLVLCHLGPDGFSDGHKPLNPQMSSLDLSLNSSLIAFTSISITGLDISYGDILLKEF